MLLFSPNMFSIVSEFDVLDFDPILSDVHSPVSLSLHTKGTPGLIPNTLNDVTVEDCEANTVVRPRCSRENEQFFL